MKEKELQEQENDRIRRLKEQAMEFEKQQRDNIRTIKGEYSEFLNNQMKERQYTEDIYRQEKISSQEDIRMKHQLLKETEKRQQLERLENQLAYREVLHEQERFKNAHPEHALKVTDSPNRSEGVKRKTIHNPNPLMTQGGNKGLNHYPSNSSIKRSVVPSQDLEPVGPVDANIGHKSNYRPPNPILTPISDPLYNPYVRREVTNSLHDPKKKSIYLPPSSYPY